jgi:outer membrane biosynthesis protein TonB
MFFFAIVIYGRFVSSMNTRPREIYNVSVVGLGEYGSVGSISGSKIPETTPSAKDVTKETKGEYKGGSIEKTKIEKSKASTETKERQEIIYSKNKVARKVEHQKEAVDTSMLEEKIAKLREEAYLKERLKAIGAGSSRGGGYGREIYTYTTGGGLSFGVSLGGSGSGNVDPLLSIYIGKIVRKIQSNWSYPEKGGAKEAIVVVKIDRSGRIVDLFFEKKSGDALFDSSVYRAVKFSSPFGSLPETWKYDYMELGIRFRL